MMNFLRSGFKMIKIKDKSFWEQVIVLIVFVIAAGLFYSNPDQFVSDNSLFYPVVAKNIVETGVSTFNGYIETYGYQPLWMLVSVLAVFLSKVFSLNVLMTIGFFYHLFLAGALVIVFKTAKRWRFFSAPIVAITFIFMFISNGVLHNMESAMALFFVLLTIYYALSIKKLTSTNMFLLGVLVGFTFLSRLDLLFFGLITTLYTFFIFRKELFNDLKLFLFYFLGVGLIVSPYLICNEVHFGALLPISGKLSQGFPTLSYAWANIYPYGAASLLIAAVEWSVAWSAKTRRAKEIILIMSLSTIFQIIYVAFFQHPQSWYFITGFVNFAVILGYLLYRIDWRWLNYLALCTLVVVTIGSAYLKTVSNYALSAHVLKLYQDKVGTASWIFSNISDNKAHALAIHKVLPEGSVVLAGYYPGSLAYYAKLRVFAANGLSDGLIRNHAYDKDFIASGPQKAWKDMKIQYNIVPLSRAAVLWYNRLGFNVDDEHYSVLLYSALDSNICAEMQYRKDGNVSKVKLSYASTGYAGIFPVKSMKECPKEASRNIKRYYSRVIDK